MSHFLRRLFLLTFTLYCAPLFGKTLVLNYPEQEYKKWVDYFLIKDRNRFERFMSNAEKVRPIVIPLLEKSNLPLDLFFVAFIESGFQMQATSHARAKGPWQFMAPTARQYGLRVNRFKDERTSIVLSTRAAISYFSDLYNIFGSWDLALASYNAGENRIIRAIRKGGSRDFRVLSAQGYIPQETVSYIPKVAAARYAYLKIMTQRKGKTFHLGYQLKFYPKSQMTSNKMKGKLKTVHVVKKGEYWSLLSQQYKVSIYRLKEFNQVNRDTLFVGERIFIPES